jgi:signal transduction histidine kinase
VPDRALLAARERLPRATRFAGSRSVFILLVLSVALLLTTIAAFAIVSVEGADINQKLERTQQTQAAIDRMTVSNERFENARRGYLISGRQSFLSLTGQALDGFQKHSAEVARLVSDDPVQAARIARVLALQSQRERVLSVSAGDLETYRALYFADFDNDPGVRMVRDLRALIDQMARTEDQHWETQSGVRRTSLTLVFFTGGLALLLLVVVLIVVVVLVLRYNRALTNAQYLLRGANEYLEQNVAARTAELVRANQEIQRFAYIVSHDLRSPLVNVLGFTAELDEARNELQRFLTKIFERHPALRDEKVVRAVEEDLPEAVGFIRTSAEKMDRLITSILQLSRQGRRQLAPEPLKLTEVAQTVVDSLQRRALDAGATVTIDPLPEILSDRVAIEQILSNLVENALKYLSPDRAGEVRISGGEEAGMVHIDVADNGRGIDPKDHERIFDLFRRSGTQDKAGEGIGLAHVRALAYRLGGTVSVESELDRGARFRLSLPAQFLATESIP